MNNTPPIAQTKIIEPKKNAPLIFSHGKGKWGEDLRTTINEGIVITNFQKIDTYIAKQCSHVKIPHFVMGSHLGQ
jgi:hypothetical protein